MQIDLCACLHVSVWWGFGFRAIFCCPHIRTHTRVCANSHTHSLTEREWEPKPETPPEQSIPQTYTCWASQIHANLHANIDGHTCIRANIHAKCIHTCARALKETHIRTWIYPCLHVYLRAPIRFSRACMHSDVAIVSADILIHAHMHLWIHLSRFLRRRHYQRFRIFVGHGRVLGTSWRTHVRRRAVHKTRTPSWEVCKCWELCIAYIYIPYIPYICEIRDNWSVHLSYIWYSQLSCISYVYANVDSCVYHTYNCVHRTCVRYISTLQVNHSSNKTKNSRDTPVKWTWRDLSPWRVLSLAPVDGTYEWVMPVAHVHESCHKWMRHVACEWGLAHMNGARSDLQKFFWTLQVGACFKHTRKRREGEMGGVFLSFWAGGCKRQSGVRSRLRYECVVKEFWVCVHVYIRTHTQIQGRMGRGVESIWIYVYINAYIYVDICTHLCMCVHVGAGKELGVECV